MCGQRGVPVNSMEEDALFEAWSWTKNLVQRRWESPRGGWLTFDDVVGLSETPAGEATLREVVRQYGEGK